MGKSIRKRRIWVAIVGITFLLVVAFLLITSVAYTEYAFICTNTGSRKGYKEWVTGKRTNEWSIRSPLEQFLAEDHPEKIEHDWVSYAGTGKNVFGGKLSHGHGRAGAILRLRPVFEEWFALLSDDEKLEAYSIFKSGDQDEIWKLVDDAYAKVSSSN